MKKIILFLILALLLLSCNPNNPTPPNCFYTYTITEKWNFRPNYFISKDTMTRTRTCNPVTYIRDTVYYWDYYIIIYNK